MKLVIVDDDRLVGLSLKTIIEAAPGMEVAAVGLNGRDAITLYEQHRPDVLLMDIRMDGMTGLEAGEALLKRFQDARVLFLTTFADDEYIVKALKMGAKGYLLKQNFESIVPSLLAVKAGQSVFGEDIVAKIPSLMGSSGKADIKSFGITEKEGDLIALVAEGLSNKEIAERLYLSEGTVRNSLSVILDKLNLRGRTQLAIFYYKNIVSV
jgi:DNA-binding NarL/FixJ family response regulator